MTSSSREFDFMEGREKCTKVTLVLCTRGGLCLQILMLMFNTIKSFYRQCAGINASKRVATLQNDFTPEDWNYIRHFFSNSYIDRLEFFLLNKNLSLFDFFEYAKFKLQKITN